MYLPACSLQPNPMVDFVYGLKANLEICHTGALVFQLDLAKALHVFRVILSQLAVGAAKIAHNSQSAGGKQFEQLELVPSETLVGKVLETFHRFVQILTLPLELQFTLRQSVWILE